MLIFSFLDYLLHDSLLYFISISVMQLFTPLAFGASLVIAKPGGHVDPDYIVDLLYKNKVTCYFDIGR